MGGEQFSISRRIEEQQAAKARESVKTEPPSVADILKDPKLFDALVEYLNTTGQGEIVKKLMEEGKALNENDLKNLEEARERIKEAEIVAKEIMKRLTPERIDIICQNSDKFNQIVGAIGKDRAMLFLENYLIRIAIRNPDNIEKIKNNLNEIEQAENAIQQNEPKILKIMNKYGLSENEIFAQRGLESIIRSRLGLWEKIKNWYQQGKISEELASKVSGGIQDIKNQINIINENLKNIADIIATTIIQNDDFRALLTLELQKAAGLKVEEVAQPVSFNKAFEAAKEEEVRREWDDFIKSEDYKKDFEGKPDEAKEYFVRNYLKKRKIGWLSGIGKFLAGFIKDLISQ